MNLFELTYEEVAGELARRLGKDTRHHAARFYRDVFKRGKLSHPASPGSSGSPQADSHIDAAIILPGVTLIERIEADGVTKFASRLDDGNVIESVIIPSNGRNTLCVSSQAGCRMGCTFCATGQFGLARSLTAGEIVWQVHTARFALGHSIDNVVFMGMGEPLDNLDNVMRAINVISDQRGLDIQRSHITVSTAGHADGIRRLASLEPGRLRLAVSLNAADDALRSRLMPINRMYPLTRLKQELLAFPLGTRDTILIEYVLIDGINNSREDAARLADYLADLPVRINIIPCNPGVSEAFKAPSTDAITDFCKWLVEKKLFVRRRTPRGLSAQAACGQLGARHSPARG
ncbi:MAG: 23S rRNA (adenine(2503)-C(2))-methyltransferase RlmN [bacterium]